MQTPSDATEYALHVQKGTASPSWSSYSRVMISHMLGRISKLGPTMVNLVASAVGCFIFTPGLRMVVMDEDGLGGELPTQAHGRSSGLSIGIGAAIFLMIFIASETLAAITALRR